MPQTSPDEAHAPAKQHSIYLVSDGTCRTADMLVRAGLVQFEHSNVHLVRKANVHRAQTIRKIVRNAARDGALIFHTLVAPDARAVMEAAAQKHMVPTVDVLGPVLVGLFDLLRSEPQARPGLLHQSNRMYYERVDAVEYTLHHDDGRRIHELEQADVVLVGVSRACKSTTCFYLAYSGIRAANVPLFADSKMPEELLALDPRRVIGLLVNPHRLEAVRNARLRAWGMDPRHDYVDRMQIARELRDSHEAMEQQGWRCIDVSYKAVEEVAREVRQLLDEAGLRYGRRRQPQE